MATQYHKPTFLQSLAAGGVAGTVVDLTFFPIDTMKTRLQSAQGFARAGGFKGMYKGVGSVIVGSAPGAALFFSTYETLKQNLPLSENLAPVKHMISASVGEVTACLIRVPTEVVKTRMQTLVYAPAGLSSLSAAKTILVTDGLRGFYQGFSITILREIPFTSLQFPLYEFLKARLSAYLNKKPLRPHEAALCGSIAGGFSASATTPLDVLKTRIMLDMRDPNKVASISLYSRIQLICATEGIKALFAGVVPRTLWISAGGAVFLGAYEWVSFRLRTPMDQR